MKNYKLEKWVDKVLGIGVIFVSSLLLLNSWSFALDSIEVVQSVPVETQLKVDGVREAQSVWLEMINSAQSQIDIEQFYISNQKGELLEPVLDAIRAAAARGVRVRLLLDSKFFVTYPEPAQGLGKILNIELRIINYSKLGGGVQHAKFFVIDKSQSFVGSQNFDWRALNHIHEIGLKVVDKRVANDLEAIFERDWAEGVPQEGSSTPFTEFSALPPLGDILSQMTPVTVVASPPQFNPSGISESNSSIVSLLNSAQEFIRIEVMEFTTRVYDRSGKWVTLDEALRAAAHRGVQVQLMVDISDLKKAKSDLESLASVPHIEVRTVTIPKWSGGNIDYARLIHSKFVDVDGQHAWVGSENWSKGYFFNSRDVGLVVHSPDVGGKLDQIFRQVWNSPYSTRVKSGH